MLRVMLELIRIILIIALLGSLFGYVLKTIYSEIGIYNDKYEWTLMLGVFILIFILYRNKLQFSGWYTGKGRQKLPKRATQLFIITSTLLILSPALLSFALH